jgi:glycosyltransferase involved in cell wall biosynthesis
MIKNLTIITLDSPAITDFATARNTALAGVKTPWVLFLDSDETLTPELEEEISQVCSQKDNAYSAYCLRRLDTFMGRQLRHGETGHAKFIRLAKKDFGKWERPVHETWRGNGKVGELKYPLLHDSHPQISTFLDKINRYSTIDAKYRFDRGQKSSLVKIALYPIIKFKLNYFLRLGFMDGLPGAVMAIMMSFHSYLTWTKLYLLWHKK